MSAKLKKGDSFLSRRLDDGVPKIVTVVQAVARSRPGFALVDSEDQWGHVVWRVYVKRARLLDPRHYTRREASP